MIDEISTQRIAGIQQNMSLMAIKQNSNEMDQIANMLSKQTKEQTITENSTFSVKI